MIGWIISFVAFLRKIKLSFLEVIMRYFGIFLFIPFIYSSVIAKDYLGAEVFSKNTVKFGRFEFRMMAAYGSGTLSTFFLYFNDSWEGLPKNWREIDVEVLGKNSHAFQSNIITGHASAKVTSEKIHSFNQDLTRSFHTYVVEWTPDYIAWYLDGTEVRRTTGQQVTDCRGEEQSYRFNTWISENSSWVGAFDQASLPLYQYINWIKYYSFTPGSGENGSDFTFSWEDSFDNFNSGRWSKGAWTFEENKVDFSPGNIVVKDGYMILCLTRANAPGHTGSIPRDNPVETRGIKIKDGNKHFLKNHRFGAIIPFTEAERNFLRSEKVYTIQGRNIVDFISKKRNSNLQPVFIVPSPKR